MWINHRKVLPTTGSKFKRQGGVRLIVPFFLLVTSCLPKKIDLSFFLAKERTERKSTYAVPLLIRAPIPFTKAPCS